MLGKLCRDFLKRRKEWIYPVKKKLNSEKSSSLLLFSIGWRSSYFTQLNSIEWLIKKKTFSVGHELLAELVLDIQVFSSVQVQHRKPHYQYRNIRCFQFFCRFSSKNQLLEHWTLYMLNEFLWNNLILFITIKLLLLKSVTVDVVHYHSNMI